MDGERSEAVAAQVDSGQAGTRPTGAEAAAAHHLGDTAQRLLALGIAARAAYAVAGLFIFILALEIMKTGARGMADILANANASGPLNLLGFGWVSAYILMSGSPVAAISLSLFSQGTIGGSEALAMLSGSRLGASLIVLVVGFALYVSRRRTADGLYIGVVALLTAFTMWLPALPLSILLLKSGWMDGLKVSTPGAVTSFVDVAYDPITARLADNLPDLLIFALGVICLLGAFTVFDRALPNLEQPSLRLERIRETLHRPWPMFLLGLGITALTLSVSISVTLLVPLSLKGWIRRENIIPYVMGANISTWVDTLLAAVLLNSERAFTIVLVQMTVGAALSLLTLLLIYPAYSRTIAGLAHRLTLSQREFALFLGVIFVIPCILFFL